MTSPIDSAVRGCLTHHGITNGVVIVGVSGGIDSITLAHALVGLRREFDLEICIVHVNHGLRGQFSDDDQLFVERFSAAHECTCITLHAAVSEHPLIAQLGTEAVARELRYEAFARAAREQRAAAVFAAHTCNDNVETFLMNAARGSGYKGLAAIPKARMLDDVCPLLRPLLDCSREDIEHYAAEKGLTWRHDHTNDSAEFTRNRVRHLVMPALRQAIGDASIRGIHTTAQHMRSFRNAVDVLLAPYQRLITTTHESGSARSEVNVEETTLLHRDVQRLLLLDALACSSDDVERIMSLMHAEVGSRATLQHGRLALRERRTIIIGKSSSQETTEYFIHAAGCYVHEDQELVIDVMDCPLEPTYATDDVMFDADAMSFPLVWRTWSDGDRIIPFGMHGSSILVSDLLTNSKVPHETRRMVRVLTDGSSILWVCGLRRSAYAPVMPQTSRVVRCKFTRR